MAFKPAVEVAITAVVAGYFYYYLPDLMPFVGIIIIGSWGRYLYEKFNERAPVLSPTEWKKFPLIEKISVSHNVALYRFGLPHPEDFLGLPIGQRSKKYLNRQHISVQAEIGGKSVQRSYTPTSSDDDLGHFDLLIKTYPSGIISKHIAELKIGDQINVKGPKGQFKYAPGLVRAMGMVAGGTGITPMLQIIRAILKNADDKTVVSLIFANITLEDILLKDELDALAAGHDNFTVHYTLDKPPEGWTGSVGFVTADMIKKYCPAPAADVKILLCGPPPMVSSMKKHCEALNYEKPRAISKLEDQVFVF
ncbi:9284_t:CDS:2 [Paraglomus occultum]|uniref:NADH-cytochrome b5 reductase n=1 Tax=Paraglomus occultum TaxID=144539 RepID=A0A9N9DKX2_9GLOM|nr:9284_t:CDS:2 [Paraglomus occultum]